MNGERKTPLSARSIDKVKGESDPAGKRISNADKDTVHADEQSSDLWWSNLTLVERHKRNKSTNTDTSDKPHSDVHADVDTPCLESASDERDYGCDEDCLAAP